MVSTSVQLPVASEDLLVCTPSTEVEVAVSWVLEI